MSINRRNKIWWIDVTSPSGERIRRSTGTEDRKLALEYHDTLKVELWRVEKMGEKKRRTWKEAVERWYSEKLGNKKTLSKDVQHLRWLHPYLGQLFLDEVTRETVDQLTLAKQKGGAKPATVNRLLALVRAILRRARDEWEWVDRVPKVTLLKEPKRRVRFLAREEASRLIDQLPPHLAQMTRFALATGLRQGNIKRLRWSQVDLENRRVTIPAEEMKNGRAFGLPLSSDAVLVVRGQQHNGSDYVFAFRGRPVNQVSTKAWWRALERAGIEDFRFHDLRHTFASWHVQDGTPLNVLQELCGWESVEMVRRYAHLRPDDLAAYAEKLSVPNLYAIDGTNSAQAKT